jgi:hypothetical protein
VLYSFLGVGDIPADEIEELITALREEGQEDSGDLDNAE